MLERSGDAGRAMWYAASMATRMQMRLFVLVVGGTLALLIFGAGEFMRCCRTVLGPTTLTYADATQKGLAGYGYVRISGTMPTMEHAALVATRNRKGGEQRVIGAYVPFEREKAVEVG